MASSLRRQAAGTGPAADLMVVLDRGNGVPLRRQLEASIRSSVQAGRLAVGTSLPPTRTLAADLGVSRGVVVDAYEQLVAEGYLVSRSGGYTQVAAARAVTVPVEPLHERPRPAVDFGYGRADTANFPRAAWLRSFRRVVLETPHDRFAYAPGGGLVEARTAIAQYLNRVRGTAAEPDDVVVCNGYAQGIALLVHVLAGRGARTLAVEDPSSDDDARPAATRTHGMDVVGVPVGDDGLDVAALRSVHADLLVLTPSHQWPTGGVLPASSRAAVLDWAREHDAVVVEDDYDAEFRYDRSPVGAMQGLAPDRVVYSGTVSKTLAPGVRIGWLVVPPHLRDEVRAAKVAADRGSSAFDQLTLADFLGRGELDRHLRRMRPVYRERRDVLLAELARRLPALRPTGVAAGTHLVTWLPGELDEQAVVEAAARRGLAIAGVRPYRLRPEGPGGLVFGYACLSPRTIQDGVARLADAVADVGG